MNLIAQLKSFLNMPEQVRPSREERDLVRRVGSTASVIRYCGRSDLVGLKIIGVHYGIRVEQGPNGRYVRLIRMIKGREVLTPQALPLHLDKNKAPVIGSFRQWVS